jgi:hypothetical protein
VRSPVLSVLGTKGFGQNSRIEDGHQFGGAGWRSRHVGYSPKSGYDAALRYLKRWATTGLPRCKKGSARPRPQSRRFLLHVVPKDFHRIRHYGLLADGNRAANIAHARTLLAVPCRPKQSETPEAAIDEPCGSAALITISVE